MWVRSDMCNSWCFVWCNCSSTIVALHLLQRNCGSAIFAVQLLSCYGCPAFQLTNNIRIKQSLLFPLVYAPMILDWSLLFGIDIMNTQVNYVKFMPCAQILEFKYKTTIINFVKRLNIYFKVLKDRFLLNKFNMECQQSRQTHRT